MTGRGRAGARGAIAAAATMALAAAAWPAGARARPAAPSAPTPAAPATPPAPESDADRAARADRLLDEGGRLFADERDLEGAQRAFEESYALRPSWRALSGLATIYQEQGRHLDALHAYERLLAEFHDLLSDAQIERVERRMAAVRAHLATVEVVATQPDVTVRVDNDEIGRGPLEASVPVMPGFHAVSAVRQGHEPFAQSVELVAGQTVHLVVEVEPQRERLVVRVEQPRMARRMPRWVPWTALAGGAALAAAGGLFTWSASSDFAAFDDGLRQDAGDLPVPGPGDVDLRERAERKRDAGTVLYVAAGAAAVTGVVLLLLNQPRRVAGDTAPVSVDVGAGAARLTIRF